MELLVVAWLAFGISLGAFTVAVWRTRRTYNDSDINELAEEVARLARRARADTMRRVRQEKGGAPADGAIDVQAPPELRTALTHPSPKETKQELRRRLLADVTQGWRH